MLGFGQDKWLLQVKTNCGPCRFPFSICKLQGNFSLCCQLLSHMWQALPPSPSLTPSRKHTCSGTTDIFSNKCKHRSECKCAWASTFTAWYTTIKKKKFAILKAALNPLTGDFFFLFIYFVLLQCHSGNLCLCSAHFTVLYWLQWKLREAFCLKSGAKKQECVYLKYSMSSLFFVLQLYLPYLLNTTI